MHRVESFKRTTISAVALYGTGNWFFHVEGTKQAEGLRKYNRYIYIYIIKVDILKKSFQF
jgi:hypothetical protein